MRGEGGQYKKMMERSGCKYWKYIIRRYMYVVHSPPPPPPQTCTFTVPMLLQKHIFEYRYTVPITYNRVGTIPICIHTCIFQPHQLLHKLVSLYRDLVVMLVLTTNGALQYSM